MHFKSNIIVHDQNPFNFIAENVKYNETSKIEENIVEEDIPRNYREYLRSSDVIKKTLC